MNGDNEAEFLEDIEAFNPDELVPDWVIKELDKRKAEDEADPQPHSTWEEVKARIRSARKREIEKEKLT